MKKIILASCVLTSSYIYAGGSAGGVSGLHDKVVFSLSDMAFRTDDLPKVYLNKDAYRRTEARLSTMPSLKVTTLDGQSLEVKKVLDSIVDQGFSKEVLPEDKAQ